MLLFYVSLRKKRETPDNCKGKTIIYQSYFRDVKCGVGEVSGTTSQVAEEVRKAGTVRGDGVISLAEEHKVLGLTPNETVDSALF